jgi:AcrR family transcriptional regulator
MARPVSIKDETIIEAARQVFLERGIQGTTAEVAERAGVSEGSVFKRFKSKGDLFRAAMADCLADPSFARDLPARVGEGDVRETMFHIGMEVVAFFRRIIPLHMMAWSNPGPNGPATTGGSPPSIRPGLPAILSGPNPPPLRALKNLTAFFEAEMHGGRLRRHDPEIVARAFLGSVSNFVFFELLYQANGELPLAAETYLRGLVSLLWAGIEPQELTAPSKAPARAAAGKRLRA